MKEIGKWQIVSFMSRGMAMVLGILQSFVIIRLLSVREWGLIQLAVSIGGALGIYQHLGLASASTREISAAKDNKSIFKIFVTSASIRYLITLPLVFGLFFYSDYLSTSIYKNPEIAFPLKIYAITLFFQGFQSILNSVISGMKRFKLLFSYQVVISVISVLLYIPLVYLYKINGYFYAFLAFNVLNTIFLTIVAFRPLRGSMKFPSVADFKILFKDIFSISIGIYVVKIIYTNWEKLGGTLLGLHNSAELVGIFAFATLFAKKILSISDAVTVVNLPVLSEKYHSDVNDFKVTFQKNFDKVFALIVISASVATYWSPEIIRIVVGSEKYKDALPLIPILVTAFVIYSVINIVNSSVLIPAKMTKQMIASYSWMLVVSIVAYYSLNSYLGGALSMAIAVTLGASASLIVMVVLIKKKINYSFFVHDHLLVLIQMSFIGWAGGHVVGLIKVLGFLPLLALLFWGLSIANLVTNHDVMLVKNKLITKFSRNRIQPRK